MEFFQLHHPLNATVLCDHKGCEQVADYLEVDDQRSRISALRFAHGQQDAFFETANAETKS